MLIWDQFGTYYSKPTDVPYSPNQFLGLDFFDVSYSKPALAGNFYSNQIRPFRFIFNYQILKNALLSNDLSIALLRQHCFASSYHYYLYLTWCTVVKT